jgi:hypothetical protein
LQFAAAGRGDREVAGRPRPVADAAGLVGHLFEQPLEHQRDGLPLAVEPGGGRRHPLRELADADREDRVPGPQLPLEFAQTGDCRVERLGVAQGVAGAGEVAGPLPLPGRVELAQRLRRELLPGLLRSRAAAAGDLRL